jgi:hypothetical protein
MIVTVRCGEGVERGPVDGGTRKRRLEVSTMLPSVVTKKKTTTPSYSPSQLLHLPQEKGRRGGRERGYAFLFSLSRLKGAMVVPVFF